MPYFGESVTAIRQVQVINPDAPEGLPAPTGDGKAAVAAMRNYERALVQRPGGNGTPGGFTVDFGGGYGGVGMSGGSNGAGSRFSGAAELSELKLICCSGSALMEGGVLDPVAPLVRLVSTSC